MKSEDATPVILEPHKSLDLIYHINFILKFIPRDQARKNSGRVPKSSFVAVSPKGIVPGPLLLLITAGEDDTYKYKYEDDIYKEVNGIT